MFTGTFLGDDSDAAQKYTDVFTWGDAWGAASFTAAFNGANSDAAQKYTDAFTWGDAWNNAVFTATFSVDTTGLTNAANIADRVAAHIAAVMPHSPAKEGPLKKPITFDYITANFESAAGRLKRSANASALQLAQAFAPNGMAGGLLNASLRDAYAAQRMTAAQAAQATQPAPANVTTVNQYALHSDEYAKLLADAQRGANAEHWIRTAHA